ncbi:MAG TPA: sugar kinase [Pseudonocardiaceae bacterium]|jgi:2-dehydro-3-deoxygluconokinase|nr:sugar kinase [Pseudonocardiaceae bacterium]
MTDVLTFGETMAVIRAVEPGPLRFAQSLRLSVAGAESTVAVGLARLGHAARWVGRVGADEFGQLVTDRLRAERVDVTYVAADDAATGLLVREQRTADLARVRYYRSGSAGSRLSVDDLVPALGDGARLLLLSGITPALSQSCLAATRAALSHAVASGWEVCLDVNYRAALWSRPRAAEVLTSLVPSASIVVGDDEELALVGGVDGLLAAGVREVVVKQGAAGASVSTVAGTCSVPAVSVTAVDVVGAGDAFVAGYLSGLLDGLILRDRLVRGVTVAGFAVACVGDWEGLPTRAELAVSGPPGTTLR